MATPGYSGKTLVAISALFIVLEFTFVVLRFYARRLTPSGVGWDDVLVPLAWLANLGLCVVGVRMVMVGNTSAQSNPVPLQGLDPERQASLMKYTLALVLLHLISVALPKISILCLYLRIFIKRGTRMACYVLIGVIIANWIAFSFAAIFQCTPVAYQWDKSIAHGTCFNITLFSKASSVPNIITDVVMLVLPVPVLWRLQTSTVRKLGLTMVFLTGSVGLVGSSIREMAFSTHIEDRSRFFFFLTAWSIIEAGMYLIAACLLALRPIIAQATPKWLTAYISNGHSRKPAEGLDDSNHELQLNASAPAHSHPRFTGEACLQDEMATANDTPLHYKPTFPIVRTYEYHVERGPLGEKIDHDPRFITSKPRNVI